MKDGSDREETKVWTPALVFLIDTIIGIAIFLVVAAGAVALGLCIDFLKTWKIDPVIIIFLKTFEYMVLVADGVLFSRYLYMSVQRGWREM